MPSRNISIFCFVASILVLRLEQIALAETFPNTDTSHQLLSSSITASASITTRNEEQQQESSTSFAKKNDLPSPLVHDIMNQQRILKSESKSNRVPKSSKVSSKSKTSSIGKSSSKSKTSSTKSGTHKSSKSSKAKSKSSSSSKKSSQSHRAPTAAPVRTFPTSSPNAVLSPESRRAKLWSQLGGTIDIVGYDSRYVFSPNNTTFVVGYNYNEATKYVLPGIVRIYKWEEDLDSWSKWGNDIPIEEQTVHDYTNIHDMSLAISLDETTIIFGIQGEVTGDDDDFLDRGEAGVYKWNESIESWQQLGNNIGGEVWNDVFGDFVALTSDGTRVAIGYSENCLRGGDSEPICVYDWNEDTSSWIENKQY